ncbi:MAG: glycosyltransferase [Pseudomonadota bacterium]
MSLLTHCLLWLSVLALAGWLYLIFVRGAFWRAEWLSDTVVSSEQRLPDVFAVMPARNEEAYVPRTLGSLLAQDYPGRLRVILVDDGSEDRTREIAESLPTRPDRELEVIAARARPAGWKGKLWAVSEGLRHGFEQMPDAPYVLLTDADVQHDPGNLRRMVAKAEANRLDMVSILFKLHCEHLWERLLVPPFIFFFRELYPFGAVNRQDRPDAAANGGCIVVRREALDRVGGIESIRDHLIDDVTLAQRVKNFPKQGAGRIWLGLSESTASLRDETSLSDIWEEVARYADTRLGHSLALLVLSVVAMLVMYILPPIALLSWPLHGSLLVAALGLGSWLCMTLVYWPIVRLHHQQPYWALTLPLASVFYTAMTIDSAWQYRHGKGGQWKGRINAPRT